MLKTHNLIQWIIALLSIILVTACAPEANKQTEEAAVTTKQSQSVDVDRILFNGNVYTFSWQGPDKKGVPSSGAPYQSSIWSNDAQAIAINDGKIIAVGDNDKIKALQTDNTVLIDLKGATVFPGFVDSHVHIAELGEILSRINLIDIESPQLVISKIKDKIKESPLLPGKWIIGQGWDEGAWANNYPNRQMLDEHFPDNPVYLKSLHGFAVWVNSAALKSAGIDKATEAPVGGEIVIDGEGVPTGILLNRATTLMKASIPEPTEQEFESWVLAGLHQMAKDGYVAIHQAGAERRHIKAFQSLKQKGKLPIRVYVMLSARDESLSEEWIEKGPLVDDSGWLDIRSVKAYYDGALGSRGARLLADYSDKPGHRGIAGDGYGFDKSIVERLIAAGFQTGIHAIGDAGNRETLDFFQSMVAKNPQSKLLRHRIEHAQVVHPSDIPRFATLGVIASMEPAHAVEDKNWAEQRVGHKRIKGAYAWRTLIENGARLTLNSDLPGSAHSIFYGLHSAVTRKDKQLKPEPGWYPEQRLSIEESIRGFTSDAAFAAFREGQTGIIAPGYWADFTLVDSDLMNIAASQPSEILKGKVISTYVAGERVN